MGRIGDGKKGGDIKRKGIERTICKKSSTTWGQRNSQPPAKAENKKPKEGKRYGGQGRNWNSGRTLSSTKCLAEKSSFHYDFKSQLKDRKLEEHLGLSSKAKRKKTRKNEVALIATARQNSNEEKGGRSNSCLETVRQLRKIEKPEKGRDGPPKPRLKKERIERTVK